MSEDKLSIVAGDGSHKKVKVTLDFWSTGFKMMLSNNSYFCLLIRRERIEEKKLTSLFQDFQMILILSTKETVVSKNWNRLHMGKERRMIKNLNILDMK